MARQFSKHHRVRRSFALGGVRHRRGLTPAEGGRATVAFSGVRHRRGFTLAEMTMTAAVMGILMLGIGGTLAFTFEASDKSISPTSRNRTSKEVLDRITRDLSESLAFSERTSRIAAFTVPDRDGDSLPETIRYAWSGAQGDPLTLEYNGGPAQTIVDSVGRFNLAYLLRTVGPPPGACCLEDGACVQDSQANCEATSGAVYQGDDTSCDTITCPVESDEMVLVFHDPSGGVSVGAFPVREYSWCGRHFLPNLPGNCISWKLTRVRFKAARVGGATGNNSVEIRSADENQQPTNTVFGQEDLPETQLPASHDWVSVTIDDVSGLDPAAGVCLVIRGMSGNQFTGEFQYQEDDGSGTHQFLNSYDRGGSWQNLGQAKDMVFYVYGTMTTTGPPQW